MGQAERLFKDACRAELQQPFGGVVAAVAAHEAKAEPRLKLSKCGDSLRTIEHGHAHIEQDQSDGIAMEPVQRKRFFSIGGFPYGEAALAESDVQQDADRRIAVDNQ